MIPADHGAPNTDFGALLRWQLPHDGPDWAVILTAESTLALALLTALLAVGVIVAARQLSQDRRFRQVQETGELFDAFEQTSFRRVLDRIDKGYGERGEVSERDRLERNRKCVYRLYRKIKSLSRHPRSARAYRGLADSMEEAIHEIAYITTRLEIYIRRGASSGSLVAEHLVYEIVVMYYLLQDVLQERSGEEDWNYEGFRDLALRMQEHSQLHHFDAELRDALKYAEFPPLCYRGGDASLGYDRSPWLKMRLWRHRLKHADDISAVRLRPQLPSCEMPNLDH